MNRICFNKHLHGAASDKCATIFSLLILETYFLCSLQLLMMFLLFFSLPGYMKERSSIAVIGLSVHTAPVEMREKLAVAEELWPRAIQELTSLNHIEEAAVLSTCNRMEIYVVALSWNRGIREVIDWMSKVSLINYICSVRSLFGPAFPTGFSRTPFGKDVLMCTFMIAEKWHSCF